MNFGVIPASGIGDSLLMHIISYHLQQLGHHVTTFSDSLPSFGSWLPGFCFRKQPTLSDIESLPSLYDALFLQHDNSPKAIHIAQLRTSSSCQIYQLYGQYHPSKHLPFNPTYDLLFHREKSVASNLVLALQYFFPSLLPTKANGMTPPSSLSYRKFPRRVAIHPLGKDPKNLWLKHRFLKLQEKLSRQGYEPISLLSPSEALDWPEPTFRPHSLEMLASFLYESGFFIGNDSGPAHLASCVQIPHLVIGKSPKHLRLWAPDWLQGELITPPPFLPQWVGMCLRDCYWPHLISTRYVINKFKNIAKQYE